MANLKVNRYTLYMDYQIREATIEDLEEILSLNRKLCVRENKEFDETIDSDYPLSSRGTEGFKASIENDDALTLVAEVGGKIIGYLTGGPARVEDYRAVENIYEAGSMWVEKIYRSKGIGAGFLRRFESWSKQRGAIRLRIEVSAENKKAINFYGKEGFKDYSLIMEKSLKAKKKCTKHTKNTTATK